MNQTAVIEDHIEFFLNTYKVVEPVMNLNEKKKSLQEFIGAWKDKTDPSLEMPIEQREHFENLLSHYIGHGIHDKGVNDSILTGKFDKDKLVVNNAAIVNDDDLKNTRKKRFTAVIPLYDDKIALFSQAVQYNMLPNDLATLQDFVFNFCFVSHEQHRIYLHEKTLPALTEYAQKIVTHKPIYLRENYDKTFTGFENIDEDEDVLANDSMGTNLTLYILQRAGLENVKLALK